MNKVIRGLKAIGNGFMPVSQIKISLVIMVTLYALFLVSDIGDYFSSQRSVPLENKQTGGTVMIAGVKHITTYTTLKTNISISVKDPMDFLFLTNSYLNECLVSLILKIVTSIFAIILVLSFDFTDPFNARLSRKVNTLCGLGIGVIFIDYVKFYYNNQWVNNTIHGTSDLKYDGSFNLFYFIGGIWLIRTILAFYQTGVKTQQEAELTI